MSSRSERRGWGDAKDAIATAKAAMRSNAFDFYLDYEGAADVVFLDDNPPIRYIHEFRTGAPKGSKKPGRIKFLCLENDDCPGCQVDLQGRKPSLVGLFTILELTHLPTVKKPAWDNDKHWEPVYDDVEEIKTKDGTVLKNPVRLLIAKRSTLEILTRQYDRRDGLVGNHYHVERSSDSKSPKVGDIWEFEEKYDPDFVALLSPDAKPLNYEELDIERSADEARRLLSDFLDVDDDDDEDEPPRKARRRAAAEDDEDEPAPKRSRRRSAPDDKDNSRRPIKW